MNIIFPESTKKYADLQCNQQLSDYTDCPELVPLHTFLEKQKPTRVLELGAGLGRASVFLKNKYDWNDTEFYLLDGDSGSVQIAGVHQTLEPCFYNSLKATYDFCVANGIESGKLHLINAETEKIPEAKFDLCYSLKAIGFHWPINEYLYILQKHTYKGSFLFFELRNPINYTSDRAARLAHFVQSQLDAIDCSTYKVVSFSYDSQFPVLLLERV